ncbi:hypothetical protein OIU84_027455, partial [Salix udensis]
MRMNLILSKVSLVTRRDGCGKMQSFLKRLERKTMHGYTLVDSAYNRDPRILRRREEGKAEKHRKKEAKCLAKKVARRSCKGCRRGETPEKKRRKN